MLTELNVHRVVITAILLAAKFFDDAYYNNAYYAKVGGVLVSELNGLEVDFLFRINFSLHVQPEVFEKYKAELVSHSINSGLIPAQLPVSTSQQLPHIPEMGSGTGNDNVHMSGEMDLSGSNQQQQQQHDQHQLAMQATAMDAANHDSMMAIRTHVTPSPPNSLEDISQMANNTMLESRPVQECKDTNELMTMNVPLESFSNKLVIQQQQEQQTLLQRANSLPPFSSTSCANHSLKVPYSAPTMPTSAPMMAMDQVQYQLVVNQLFPIENTLVHHNHHQGIVGTTTTASATMQDHHSNATSGLVGHHHHHGLGGSGLGPMAYQVSWSGQIR